MARLDVTEWTTKDDDEPLSSLEPAQSPPRARPAPGGGKGGEVNGVPKREVPEKGNANPPVDH